jgi:hypothetical protein
MSVDHHRATASFPPGLDDSHEGTIATARRQAEEARRLAAARGDYLSAERWHRQEQLLDLQLGVRDQGDVGVWRS